MKPQRDSCRSVEFRIPEQGVRRSACRTVTSCADDGFDALAFPYLPIRAGVIAGSGIHWLARRTLRIRVGLLREPCSEDIEGFSMHHVPPCRAHGHRGSV